MEIKPIYLFYGDEKFLLKKDVAFFRDYFSKEGVMAEEFDGVKDSLAAILAAAADIPLFGGRRLLIVDRAPWFAKGGEDGKGEAEALIAYADSPNEETCLVFIADRADKRMKTVKAIEKTGKVRQYEAKKSYELPEYVRKYLRAQGKTISPRGLDLFLLLCSEDLGIISGELDKLILYVGERERIEEDDVTRIVSKTAEATSFLLSDAIGLRQKDKVKRYADEILAHTKPGEYALLFGYLVNYFRLLIRVKDLIAFGSGEKAIAKELGVHEFRVKKAVDAQKKYTMEELISAMARMLHCDYKVKSGRWDYKDGLFVTLLQIVNAY